MILEHFEHILFMKNYFMVFVESFIFIVFSGWLYNKDVFYALVYGGVLSLIFIGEYRLNGHSTLFTVCKELYDKYGIEDFYSTFSFIGILIIIHFLMYLGKYEAEAIHDLYYFGIILILGNIFMFEAHLTYFVFLMMYPSVRWGSLEYKATSNLANLHNFKNL